MASLASQNFSCMGRHLLVSHISVFGDHHSFPSSFFLGIRPSTRFSSQVASGRRIKTSFVSAYGKVSKNWWQRSLEILSDVLQAESIPPAMLDNTANKKVDAWRQAEYEPALELAHAPANQEVMRTGEWSLLGHLAATVGVLILLQQIAGFSSVQSPEHFQIGTDGAMRRAIEAVEGGHKGSLASLLADNAVFTFKGSAHVLVAGKGNTFAGKAAVMKGIDKYDALFTDDIDNLHVYLDVKTGALIATYDLPSSLPSASQAEGGRHRCQVKIGFGETGLIQNMNESCNLSPHDDLGEKIMTLVA